jgi:hypothetical protein
MKVKRSSSTIALLIQYHDDNTLEASGFSHFFPTAPRRKMRAESGHG